MRFSFVALVVLSVVAFAGPVLAQDKPLEHMTPKERAAFDAEMAAQEEAANGGKDDAAVAAPAAPMNPMGAGLMVPAGEAASPVAADQGILIYSAPDLQSEQVGVLQSVGSTIDFQTHVIVSRGADPEWKPGFFRRLFKREAPVIERQVAASEFMLSPEQKGIMVVNVQGSWLQIAQGWLQWTQAVANHARFVPWSELYQQASFAAFQLNNARADRADLVPLGEAGFREEDGTVIKVGAPARFILLDAQAGTMKVRLTGSTCAENPKPLGGEGKEGWVNLFASSGAPQLLLQPEVCAEEAKR